jgi:hypothetical protein
LVTKKASKTLISRAGWLFADLSLVLMILFAASTVKTSNPCEGAVQPSAECQASSTTLPDEGDGSGNTGFNPKPLEVVVRNGVRLTAEALIDRLESEITKSETRTSHFGVIIIYGGSRGVANSIGDDNAKKVQERLSSTWNKVRRVTFFQPGHDTQLSPSDIQLKLFPYIQDNTK